MTVDGDLPPGGLKELYQEDYFAGREYIDYVADKPAVQKTLRRHLRLVQRHLLRGGRLLEVGCAHGFFLELALRDYPGSVGVDVSHPAVVHARSLGVDAREGELLAMTFDAPFDGVCLWDTIEHLPRPAEVIRQSVALLRPGGFLFLTTGDFGAWLPRLQGLNWRQIHPPTHLFYFTRRSLRELCRHSGLEVVRFGTVTVHRRLASAWRALALFRPASPGGRLAAFALRVAPARVGNWSVPLNLGDTLSLVARKPPPGRAVPPPRETANLR
jgi:2-polyprenyl-3-methyl-5-hydroxy-6-metoxy-1,4-benzoquinol methylase